METTPAAAADSAAVNRDNPWPGLSSFTEDLRGFFFGREKETDELVRLVRRQTLTVLFGQSGLGKSSLLQAGAFPLLREADFLPLYLRLDHDAAAPALADQIKAALHAAFQAAGADAPAPRADESLWEYFHRKDIDIWSAKNRLLTPVLAFDQFEEIFTLGRTDEVHRERGGAFLSELADLVENRPPAALQAKLEAGELDPARYNFDKPSCQVILSLREDFLPDLEGLKNEMRSIMHNRMRVRRLNGIQALEIVTRPAPHLLADGVAERIVEFVAGARGGSAERLAELEVEPALLSVICRELNQRRRALGQEQITADLVSGNRREILHDFYERSVADLPPAVREFIEDRLLTKSGFRDSLALETALETPGVSRPFLDTLVSRRLLRIEERVGVQRVELTHDVLAEVIRASRDSRQQRLALAQSQAAERRTHRRLWLLRGIAVLLLILLTGASWAAWRAVRAQRLEAQRASRTDLALASRLFDEGKAGEGIAYLVRAARSDPLNSVIGPRLMSALASRNFLLPDGAPTRLPTGVKSIALSGDGSAVYAVGEDGAVWVIDSASGSIRHEFHFPQKVSGIGVARDNGGIFAAQFADDSVQVTDAATGQPRFPPLHPGPRLDSYVSAILSPDGRWLAAASEAEVWIWDAATGERRADVKLSSQQILNTLAFSRDGRRLLTAVYFAEARVWSVPDGAPVTAPLLGHSNQIYGATLSPDGTLVAILEPDGTVVREVATGAEVGSMIPGNATLSAVFSPDSKRLVTSDLGHTIRIWDLAAGKLALPILTVEGSFGHHALAIADDGRTLLARSTDGYTRLWDLATGALLAEPAWQQEQTPNSVVSANGSRVYLGTSAGLILRLRLEKGSAGPLVLPYGPKFLEARFESEAPARLRVLLQDRLLVIDATTGREVGGEIVFPEPITLTRLLRDDGAYIAVRTQSGRNQVWALSEAGVRVIAIPDLPQDPGVWYEFSPKGDLFSVTTTDQIQIWSLLTGRRLAPPIASYATAILQGSSNFSPDGRWFSAAAAGEAKVWDVATSQLVFELTPLPYEQIDRASFSPDGTRIATATVSGEARLWDVATHQPASPVLQHRFRIRSVEFSRDSRLLATSTYDGAGQIWDAGDGKPVGQPFFHAGSINGTAFNRAGSRLATASNDTTARVWDTGTGLALTEPMNHGSEAKNPTFSPGDENFISTFTGDRAFVWAIPPDGKGAAVPDWMVQLATICAGKRVTNEGTVADAGGEADRIDAVRREVANLPESAPFAPWGKWFFADRATRPVAPGFRITALEAQTPAAEMQARLGRRIDQSWPK